MLTPKQRDERAMRILSVIELSLDATGEVPTALQMSRQLSMAKSSLHGAEDRGLMRPGQRGHIVNENGTIDTGKWVRLKDGSFIPAPRVEGVAVG